jgi:hypothetical protein
MILYLPLIFVFFFPLCCSSVKRFTDGLPSSSFASQQARRNSNHRDHVTSSMEDQNHYAGSNLEFDRGMAGHSSEGYYNPRR